VRGFASNQAEQAIQDALMAALAEYPEIKIVSEASGDWKQSVTQQKIAGVLPTLSQIDIVFSRGVAAFGAAQVLMVAGKDVPLLVHGFDGMDVKMLMDMNAKSGYESVAINTDPYPAGRGQDQRLTPNPTGANHALCHQLCRRSRCFREKETSPPHPH
jgi:ribose transport system substrate-binding protein